MGIATLGASPRNRDVGEPILLRPVGPSRGGARVTAPALVGLKRRRNRVFDHDDPAVVSADTTKPADASRLTGCAQCRFERWSMLHRECACSRCADDTALQRLIRTPVDCFPCVLRDIDRTRILAPRSRSVWEAFNRSPYQQPGSTQSAAAYLRRRRGRKAIAGGRHLTRACTRRLHSCGRSGNEWWQSRSPDPRVKRRGVKYTGGRCGGPAALTVGMVGGR